MRGVFFLVVILVFSYSCKKGCWESSGNETSEIRELAAFNKMDIDDIFIVHMIQDSASFVELKGKSNLISHIETKVEDACLKISDKNTCKLNKGYHQHHLYIHFEQVDNIYVKGSSELHSQDSLLFENLNIEVSGDIATWDLKMDVQELQIRMHSVVGELKVAGRAKGIYLYTSGRNHCFFKDLICDKATINHTSVGDYYLTVKNGINIAMNNYGDFYCYGNPENRNIKLDKYKTGQVYFLNE